MFKKNDFKILYILKNYFLSFFIEILVKQKVPSRFFDI